MDGLRCVRPAFTNPHHASAAGTAVHPCPRLTRCTSLPMVRPMGPADIATAQARQVERCLKRRSGSGRNPASGGGAGAEGKRPPLPACIAFQNLKAGSKQVQRPQGSPGCVASARSPSSTPSAPRLTSGCAWHTTREPPERRVTPARLGRGARAAGRGSVAHACIFAAAGTAKPLSLHQRLCKLAKGRGEVQIDAAPAWRRPRTCGDERPRNVPFCLQLGSGSELVSMSRLRAVVLRVQQGLTPCRLALQAQVASTAPPLPLEIKPANTKAALCGVQRAHYLSYHKIRCLLYLHPASETQRRGSRAEEVDLWCAGCQPPPCTTLNSLQAAFQCSSTR